MLSRKYFNHFSSVLPGVITLREKIDREACSQHELVIMVRDQGAPSKRNFVKVSILVTDHNDHQPRFLSRRFHGSVFETAAVGTSVVQVLAIDKDKGKNSEMKMSIISGKNQSYEYWHYDINEKI